MTQVRGFICVRGAKGKECTPIASPCHVCGGTGQVPRAYVERDCSYEKSKERVPCPRCMPTEPPRAA